MPKARTLTSPSGSDQALRDLITDQGPPTGTLASTVSALAAGIADDSVIVVDYVAGKVAAYAPAKLAALLALMGGLGAVRTLTPAQALSRSTTWDISGGYSPAVAAMGRHVVGDDEDLDEAINAVPELTNVPAVAASEAVDESGGLFKYLMGDIAEITTGVTQIIGKLEDAQTPAVLLVDQVNKLVKIVIAANAGAVAAANITAAQAPLAVILGTVAAANSVQFGE